MQFRDHVDEICEREILHKLATFSKKVLADLRQVQPGEKREFEAQEHLQNVVTMRDEEANVAFYDVESDIFRLPRNEMLPPFVSRLV